MIKMYDANDNYGMGAGYDPNLASLLDATGNSPAARQRRHDENMSVLYAGLTGAAIGAGVDALRNRNAGQTAQPTAQENAPQADVQPRRRISAGWVLAGLFVAVYILAHVLG